MIASSVYFPFLVMKLKKKLSFFRFSDNHIVLAVKIGVDTAKEFTKWFAPTILKYSLLLCALIIYHSERGHSSQK